MGIDYPPPSIRCNGIATTPGETGSMELVSYDFPVLHVATPSQPKSDLRTMTRKRSKRKAVREDRPMLLSRRESQVVELMGKGLSRAEISDRLGVSRKCVSVFIERARGKFHLKTSLQLRHLAFRSVMSAGKQPR
jgi:DNA-binding NarL/FixJ family response regulator